MNKLILNDVHLGAIRSAGTTLTTRRQIVEYLQGSFCTTVFSHLDKDILIAGDLFDTFSVEVSVVLETYFTLADWLKESKKRLTLMRGNHDIAKNSEKTSSFDFLCSLLVKLYPDQVQIISDTLTKIDEHVWAIPHVVNQDLFDIEMTKALSVAPSYLFFHANYDNNFAVDADHSLNVSEEWADKFIAVGHTLVFAHEHLRRTLKGGNVQIMGNQWPSSIADCLSHGAAQADNTKYAHLLSKVTTPFDETVKFEGFPTWEAEGDFIAMDWKELEPCEHRFIRISGKATADQAADVINAISKYRQKSPALVITNGVSIAGVAGMDDMSDINVEKLQSINVLEALCDQLTVPEAAVVRELLEKK